MDTIETEEEDAEGRSREEEGGREEEAKVCRNRMQVLNKFKQIWQIDGRSFIFRRQVLTRFHFDMSK